MSKIISFSFVFQLNEYYVLAHIREQENETIYSVTVMNEELEKLLYGNGNFVITEKAGVLLVNESSGNHQLRQLKTVITRNLSEQVNKPFKIISGSVSNPEAERTDSLS
jgi:hypothetical protein